MEKTAFPALEVVITRGYYIKCEHFSMARGITYVSVATNPIFSISVIIVIPMVIFNLQSEH